MEREGRETEIEGEMERGIERKRGREIWRQGE